MSLSDDVAEIRLLTVDQSVPDKFGPAGRLVDAKNVIVEKFQPNGRYPQIKIQQRGSFVSLPTECRDSVDGELADVSWSNPRMLATLGDQVVSIADSIPRVSRGDDLPFTAYPDKRVVTNRLDSEVDYTSNSTLQVSDNAWLDGVTCKVWTETTLVSGVQKTTAWISFKADNGAWIISPRVLYDPLVTTSDFTAMARVCIDGESERFFVVVNEDVPDVDADVLKIRAFNTGGEELDDATITQRNDTAEAGFWDITTNSDGGILIAQPGATPDGTDVGVEIYSAVFNEGTNQIDIDSVFDPDIHCSGPVAWITNDFDDLAYLATYISTIQFTYAWQITLLEQTQEFNFGVITANKDPDSIVGWVSEGEDEDEPTITLAVSVLSNFSPDSGPPNDPALRYTKVYSLNWDGDVRTEIRQLNSVILVSRAFLHDGEYYAFTYYQSGSGNSITQRILSVDWTDGDYMIGAPEQPIEVVAGDSVTGSPVSLDVGNNSLSLSMLATASQAAYAITGADTVAAVLASGLGAFGIPDGTPLLKWDFANTNVVGYSGATTQGARLHVVGSSIASANALWEIVAGPFAVTSPTGSVYTLPESTTGTQVVPGTFTATGTAAVLGMTAYLIPDLLGYLTVGSDDLLLFGTINVTGLPTPGNNGTFGIQRVVSSNDASSYSSYMLGPAIWALTTTQSVFEGVHGTGVITPQFPNQWTFSSHEFDNSYIGSDLNVDGNFITENNVGLEITAAGTNTLVTGSATTLRPQIFNTPFPSVNITIPIDQTPYKFFLQDLTLDYTFIGALVSVQNSNYPANNGVYKIYQINDDGTFFANPADGNTEQVNEQFQSDIVITIFFLPIVSPQFQPQWYMSPLESNTTPAVGCFEKGIAYADWRYEGDEEDIPFDNRFSMGVASVVRNSSAWQTVLPYRATSFTAATPLVTPQGQVVNAALSVGQATIGLKRFMISDDIGDPFINGRELMIPGPMATVFTEGGFSEHNVNVSPEQPFLVSQDVSENSIALTLKTRYQIIATIEATDGDRIFSLPSPPLDVQLTGDNNSATYGGRLPIPWSTLGAAIVKHYGLTNRAKIALCLYRTSIQESRPTVRHYKITSDLNPNALAPISVLNASGFSFPDEFTWNYIDENPDVTILSSEPLYTDKGFVPRFPCPPFRSGCVWLDRPWVVGYDRAIWSGGEKTEGDQSWFFPAFRSAAVDRPVAAAHNESFLVIPGADSIWYMPASGSLPASNGIGQMPKAVRMTFTNGGQNNSGGSGLARTIQTGVAYTSNAGGIWLITRDMNNIWLSKDYGDILDSANITGIAVDKKQRMHVATGTNGWFVYDQVAGCWSLFFLPSNTARLAAISGGQAIFQDDNCVAKYDPDRFFDTINGTDYSVAPDITLAEIDFGKNRSVKFVRGFQMIGTYRGPHNINTVITYPDQEWSPPTTRRGTPSSTAPYLFEFNPDPEEATGYLIRIFADFDGLLSSPGNTFELELLAAQVAVDSRQGMGKITRRLLP